MAGVASRINGMKGGRPKGAITEATKEKIASKEMYMKMFEQKKAPMFEELFKKAIGGDMVAIKECLDRAWGKPMQQTDITTNGESIDRPYELLGSDELLRIIKGK